MKNIVLIIMATLLIQTKVVYAQSFTSDLMGLTEIKENVRSKRVSSYDRTGGNADAFLNIEDGTSKVIFEVKGSGIINH